MKKIENKNAARCAHLSRADEAEAEGTQRKPGTLPRFLRGGRPYLACAMSIAEHNPTCPVCRAPFTFVLPVPSPRDDPAGWFAAVDVDGDGKLSPPEVLEVLRAQLQCDWHAMAEELPKLWRRWDING